MMVMEIENFNEHLVVNGLHCRIDFKNNLVYENGNSVNAIAVQDLPYKDGKYFLSIDTTNGNKLISGLPEWHEGIETAEIPKELFDRDYFNSLDMADGINRDSYLSGSGFIVFYQEAIDRFKGILPECHLGKDVFWFDVENDEMRPVDGLTAPIKLSSFFYHEEFLDDFDVLEGLYHLKTRQLVEDTESEDWRSHPDVVNIMLSVPSKIDSIGYARINNKPDTYYMCHDRVNKQCGVTMGDYSERQLVLQEQRKQEHERLSGRKQTSDKPTEAAKKKNKRLSI